MLMISSLPSCAIRRLLARAQLGSPISLCVSLVKILIFSCGRHQAGIFLHTCRIQASKGEYLYLVSRHAANRKDRLENLFCLRCNRELESGQKSVAVYMFAQTVGIKPRQKSAAHRICFCPQCSVSLAMGL